MIPIIRNPSGVRRDQVYLLPNTIDYYQEQLTRLLEAERFGEAREMLAFLLECKTDDAVTRGEWRQLYDWLVSTFGESAPEPEKNGEPDEDLNEEASERELRKQRLDAKMAEDPDYVNKLLDIVKSHGDLEKKTLAVEQLALADHPEINAALVRFLETADLHPLLQFKVLQTLRMRGADGTVSFRRGGETVKVAIADTPLALHQYPEPIRAVPELVKLASEQTEPGLAVFAEAVWLEFLACVYGTKLYRGIADMPAKGSAIWAAGLHEFMILSMTGDDPDEPLLPLYNLKESHAERVHRCRGFVLAYMRNPYGPDELE